MMEMGQFTYTLLHGIQLKVEEEDGIIDIHRLADFLSTTMQHFKKHCTELPAGTLVNAPLPEALTDDSGTVVGTISLLSPNADGLPATLWVECIINAYTRASSLENLLDDLPAARKAAKRDGGYLVTVISLLGRPTMHLHAFAEMVEHTIKG